MVDLPSAFRGRLWTPPAFRLDAEHRWPSIATADTGFFSRDNIRFAEENNIDVYIPPRPQAEGNKLSEETQAMRDKLARPECKAVYNTRSATVEPVFWKH